MNQLIKVYLFSPIVTLVFFLISHICTFQGEGVRTSNFTTTTGHFFQNIESVFLVPHYYDNHNIESVFLVDQNIEIDEDQNVESS